MRKTFLTTTALVMTAGAAAAEVTLSGTAEMGVVSTLQGETERLAGMPPATISKEGRIRFHTDIDVTFEMSGATDGGLEFSAAVDLDEPDAFDPDAHGGVAIGFAGAFGSITLGDTDGALDWAMTETDIGGSLRDDHTAHLGFSDNDGGDAMGLDGLYDGQILRYDSTFGRFGFALSMEMNDLTSGDDGSTILGFGTRYTMGLGSNSLDLGIGYQTGDAIPLLNSRLPDYQLGTSVIGVSASLNMAGGLTAILNWLQQDYDDGISPVPGVEVSGASGSHIGLGIGYEIGPLTVGANLGSFDSESNVVVDVLTAIYNLPTTEERTGYGFSVVYDLGGGAELQFGFGSGKSETAENQVESEPDGTFVSSSTDRFTNDGDSWSVGLAFTF